MALRIETGLSRNGEEIADQAQTTLPARARRWSAGKALRHPMSRLWANRAR